MARKRLTKAAQRLRRQKTDAEALLWSRLRGKQLGGHKFTDQFPIAGGVVDFACRSAKLAIELDGGQHASAVEKDARRAELIEAHGYRVVRYWNSDIMENLDGVLEDILRHLSIATNRIPPP